MDTTSKNEKPPTNAAIYTRISLDINARRNRDDDDDDEAPAGGKGVERQFEDCLALAERMHFVVDLSPGPDGTPRHHFDDNDMSAFSGKNRPGYEAMLEAMKRGEFSAIVCWHPDRLYRSLKDLERLIDLADAAAAQICSVNGGDFDLSTATGKMVARILGSVSRQESEHKGERQRRANVQRRAEGKWAATGKVPFGYAKVGTKLNYTIVPSEPAASMIKQAAADVLNEVSLYSICKDWNARGFRTGGGRGWTNTALVHVLVNPVYAGLVVHGAPSGGVAGEKMRTAHVVGRGEWTAILDLDTHRGLVAYLGDVARRKTVSFERLHQGSGVYVCGRCGAKMYAGWTMEPRGRPDKARVKVRKYNCWAARTNPAVKFHLARLADPLDELVTETVLSMLSETNIRSRLVDAPDVDVDELRTHRAALTARADELARMFAAGQIDGSQLGSGTAALRAQITEIDQVLAGLVATSPALTVTDGDPDELVSRWNACSADLKGKIIGELMTVVVLPTVAGRKGFDPDTIDIKPKL
jgi:site-specific DNA recombinase